MRLKNRDEELHLRRRSGLPDWASLGLRILLAFLLVGIALVGHWLDREGLRDNIDGHISFIDLLYFTMITVTTVGYGDIVPVTNSARLFDTFVVTPIRLFVWLIFLGTAYDFLLRRTWYRWRMKVIQRRLTGHVVIAGYGTSGTEALRELQRRGCDPANIVVIDRDVVILNPRRPDWNPAWRPEASEPEFRRQVEWELEALESADIIVLYLAPGSQSPVSLLELGLHARSGKVILLCPPGFWRKGNVDITAERYGIQQVASLEELHKAIDARLAAPARARR